MARFMIFDSAATLDNEDDVIGDHPLAVSTYGSPPINYELSGGGALWATSVPSGGVISYTTASGKYLIERYTKPVKISGAVDEDIEKVAIEFMVDLGAAFGGGLKTYLQWWMEFWADAGSFVQARDTITYGAATVYGLRQPFTRRDPLSTALAVHRWGREQTVEVIGSGVVKHFNVTRRLQDIGYVTERSDGSTVITVTNDSRYFPMRVHSGYMRIGMLLTEDYTAATGTPFPSNQAEAFTNVARVRCWAVVGGMDQQATLALMTKPISGFYP